MWLLRKLLDLFRPGDVVLADRLMCAWAEMVMHRHRGIDGVCQFTSHRKADFSFKGALQTLDAFQPVIALRGRRGPAFLKTL